MKWYIPSWNGDIRVEADPDDPARTLLTVIDPTPHERNLLDTFVGLFREKGWIGKKGVFGKKQPLWNPNGDSRQITTIAAKVTDIAPLIVHEYKPADDVITAVIFQDGNTEVVTGSGDELARMAEKADKKDAKKAVSTSRPTPCCPQCHTGPVDAATEVLLDFLTPAEHRQYAAAKALVVTGGLTGHRYLLAHRHTPLAQRIGRICFDLDDGAVMHFHDTGVPPAEEILATKLVLEHREPWLRSWTTIEPGRSTHVFPNPFPYDRGGIPDANFTQDIGAFASRLLGLPAGPQFRMPIPHRVD